MSESDEGTKLFIKTTPIEEDYKLSLEQIGTGMTGTIYTCISRKTGVKYAMKILPKTLVALREAEVQYEACKNCKYIVQVIDVYENLRKNQRFIIIIMEYLTGGELFAKISERTEPFNEQEVAKIMFEVCSAVKHLHSLGIAHRDLKPENLLLSTKDVNAVVKLADFGFAKRVDNGLTTPCYTAWYVSPEVLAKTQKYDQACDIWALGVIMYILCSGYPPFFSNFHKGPLSPGMKERIVKGDYDYPASEWSSISKEAKDLIDHMLETDPHKRVTIDEVMKSQWLHDHTNAPTEPLPSFGVMKEDHSRWRDLLSSVGEALAEIRVNLDNYKPIKDLKDANCSLMARRLKKKFLTRHDESPNESDHNEPKSENDHAKAHS